MGRITAARPGSPDLPPDDGDGGGDGDDGGGDGEGGSDDGDGDRHNGMDDDERDYYGDHLYAVSDRSAIVIFVIRNFVFGSPLPQRCLSVI